MDIPNEISDLFDNYHIDSLYRLCRFCFNRLSSQTIPKEAIRKPPTQLVVERALKFYQIHFKVEISDMTKPKVLCSGCRTRLANLETGKLTLEKFEKDRKNLEILPIIEDQQYGTRRITGCTSDNRCHVCQINGSCLNNCMVKLKTHGPKPGRPLEQSPCRTMFSKCGKFLENHNDKFCRNILKHPHSSSEAGKHFAERVEARGFTSKLAAGYIKDTLKKDIHSNPCKPLIGLNHPFDANNRLAITTIKYDGRKSPVLKQLSIESARDSQRLGHLGLGIHSYWELGRILRRDGIVFPSGGIIEAWDEKWSVFGSIFTPITLQMICRENTKNPMPTPFGFCTDIEHLLNIITHNQSDKVSRLKLQIDGGREFLKMSLNIVPMNPGSIYSPTPKSVLSNFVIAMGHGLENYQNLKELFSFPSIQKLFLINAPVQISCDFKVAALIVGIQQASSKYPCPYCLWRNGTSCTGVSNQSRMREEMMNDLAKKHHNVINEPHIHWSESVMEKIALAPLHILLGLVNRLFSESKPNEKATNKKDRQLYKLHCMALCKYNVFRSEYWNGTLEGNSCSRLLDHLDDIPFPASSVCFINALKTLKQVKDTCLEMVRKSGWQDSIRAFREAWRDTGLPWSLKSHILSDHYEEYLTRFENDANAGAALSSEQSGEMLHSRLQKVWDLRFKTRAENPLFSQRLVDCMVTYNYNLNWDRAQRSLENTDGEANNTQEFESESNEHDEERIELHNWLTDSENSDESDSD